VPAAPVTDRAPGAERRPALGVTSAVVAVVVWGTSSVLIKQVDGLNGVAISAYRLWIGAVLITGAFVVSGGRVTRRLLRLSFWGAVAFLADIVLFFTAVQETSVANATIIGALQPLLMLAVAGPLFGERARWSDALWGCIAIGGAAMVVFGGDGGGANSGEGDLLAVGALVAWTCYFVASKTARTQLTSFEYLTGLSIVSAVLVVPVPFLLSQPLGDPTAEAWALIAVIALVNGALGHFLMNWSHQHVPLVAISLLTLGIPVVSAATAAVFIDEPLVALQVLGMAVVVGALGVVSVHTARRRPEGLEAGTVAAEVVPEP
jgi:drug/metabolite transporter (DMT)-like permease